MDVEFLGSFTAKSLPPASYPEIAVGGRSNVGKSSFINSMLGRHGVARVSSRPGMTRTINLYLYGKKGVLADLPGYGYSRASRGEQQRWARDIELYLTGRETLKGVILIGDIRHFPTASDSEALTWFRALGMPLLVVLTKADKLRPRELKRRRSEIAGRLGSSGRLEASAGGDGPGDRGACGENGPEALDFIVFSAKTGQGKREVWSWIEKAASR